MLAFWMLFLLLIKFQKNIFTLTQLSWKAAWYMHFHTEGNTPLKIVDLIAHCLYQSCQEVMRNYLNKMQTDKRKQHQEHWNFLSSFWFDYPRHYTVIQKITRVLWRNHEQNRWTCSEVHFQWTLIFASL